MVHNDSRHIAQRDGAAGESAGEGVPRPTPEVTVSAAVPAAAPARGVLFVHSCPPALSPHVEWAVAGVLGVPVSLTWTGQSMAPGFLRCETGWRGRPGTAGRIAAALRDWAMLRFEITEEPSPGADGERFMFAPGHGLFRAATSANGDIQLGEDMLRHLVATTHGHEALAHAIQRGLGAAWDAELEPYRYAGEGVSPTWLTRVG